MITKINLFRDDSKWGDCTLDEAQRLHNAFAEMSAEMHPGAIITEEGIGGCQDRAYDEEGIQVDPMDWGPTMDAIMARAGIK